MNTLDYRNTNTLWTSVMVETLSRLGLTTAVVCPGSRSTPLTVALVRHPTIETIPILDERSAAFFALGCAKRSHQPVVLVCTSGSAGANFLPAVIEAKESHIPLILFTADRPPEMRACASGQTIDQQKLLGDFVNGYGEMAIPEVKLLSYARQTMVQTWVQTLSPTPGPFHLNCPFRDPLAPLAEPLELELDETSFFAAVLPPLLGKMGQPSLPQDILERWSRNERGIIVAGPAQPQNPASYCNAVAQLSRALGWPVLAESLSPLRNYQSLNPYLISTYDSLLRHPADQLIPDQVIQLGPLPTSKVLRQWLYQYQPLTYQVTPDALNVDPLHGRTRCVHISVESLGELFASVKANTHVSQYCQTWVDCDRTLQQNISHTLHTLHTPFEGKISWLLSQYLPKNTPLMIANSMPIRDMESFWQPNDQQIQPYFSRGANGIDGTLSTAMGIAHHHKNSLLLTGDLAFLHDTNGLLNARYLKGALTVILINNQGGGIFEMLPISDFEPPFEQYFATSQTVNIADLCHAYGVQHIPIKTWEQLTKQIKDLALPTQPCLRVLEFCTDRKADAHWRQTQIRSLGVAAT
ncbi:2-succinyl-5-enolpyruvyl-6-hydroxy-3-cyclohexene-1-carboxylic-acid synthase [Leptothoe sp. PORK10 BA2]|uniref:2-succinyl-5-enolpyruvyl-6-hydroxy-3- cyclohexene-1-carboxylic-acid synthase n=1 Tax=Leptothoe sp. PORK10 BA2 TaxID=3110254 RepID=UPI002B1F37FD|nr:2-succinyl-5-enolpyruvyl-6-hydroxy-3-cyclohexene-1-carboxylic-acid synthase [Leptothoe sp. PORK10 BA2]MEA5463503.1 2-succinyl-5-enolpyruvyl-6-hydroxy-3-cyclohexene-1-carboxylic-acid synthase [Leptothoe sp. PORK10 BA2]